MYQNREERRKFAKMAKFLRLKSRLDVRKQLEMTSRAIAAGKQLHAKYVEDNENRMVKAAKVKDESVIKGLIEIGLSKADAKKQVAHNKKLDEARAEKLWARQNKRR